MRKVVTIVSIVLVSLVLIAGIGFGIFFGIKKYNEDNKAEVKSILDSDESDQAESLYELDMSEQEFYDSIIGKSGEYYQVIDNELYKTYEVILKYKGKKLECLASQCQFRDNQEIKNENFKVSVYQECSEIPELYKVGLKLYNSFETTTLDKDINVLLVFDENGSSIYQYNDNFYHFIVDTIDFNNETYNCTYLSSKLPMEYYNKVQDALAKQGIDITSLDEIEQ